MDSDRQYRVKARVKMNLFMNEHLYDQQIYICKLIINTPALYMNLGDSFFGQILYCAKSFSLRSFDQREMMINLLSMVTAYYCRRKQKGLTAGNPSSSSSSSSSTSLTADGVNRSASMENAKPAENENANPNNENTPSAITSPSQGPSQGPSQDAILHRTIIPFLIGTTCRLLQSTASNPREHLLYKRSANLLDMIFQLKPNFILDLESVERLVSLENALRQLTEGTSLNPDQQLQVIYQLAVFFRISRVALSCFHEAFLDKDYHSTRLQNRVCIALQYIERSVVFGSLIDLLPGMFIIIIIIFSLTIINHH